MCVLLGILEHQHPGPVTSRSRERLQGLNFCAAEARFRLSLLDEVIEAQVGNAFVDSHGSFSLSLRDAWRKIGASAGSHPLHWLVYCLQSFCAARARAVYLQHKNAELWLVAHHCEEELSPREFQMLSADHLLSQTSAGLLGRGLAGAHAQEPERLLLCRWSDAERAPEAADFLPSDKQPGINPLLPSRGSALAVYYRGTARIPDLSGLLGYLLQYCPVPVHYVAHGLLWKSQTEVRSLHWLHQAPECPLYARAEQVQVSTPLLIDHYASQFTPQLLLKPPCGDDLTYFADWLEQPGDFEWLRSPGLFDGTSCQGRYYAAASQPVQNIPYDASKNIGNSWFHEKGKRRHNFLTTTGDFILLVEGQTGPDRILPILHGTTLKCLEGCLGIPGVVVIAGAAGLACDLGGMNLVRDEHLDAWLAGLRGRVRQALQQAVNQPPQARGRLSCLKTIGLASLTAAAALTVDGLQPDDLGMLFKLGVFGGAGLHTCLGFVRHYAPDSWYQRQTDDLHAELKRRLEMATR